MESEIFYRARVEAGVVVVETYAQPRRNWWWYPLTERDCLTPIAALRLALKDAQQHLTELETPIDGEFGTVTAMVEARRRIEVLKVAIAKEEAANG